MYNIYVVFSYSTFIDINKISSVFNIHFLLQNLFFDVTFRSRTWYFASFFPAKKKKKKTWECILELGLYSTLIRFEDDPPPC